MLWMKNNKMNIFTQLFPLGLGIFLLCVLPWTWHSLTCCIGQLIEVWQEKNGGRKTYRKWWRLDLNPDCYGTAPAFRACTLTQWANRGALLTPQLCRFLQLDNSMSNLNVKWRLLWFLTAQWLRMWAVVSGVLCSNLAEGSYYSYIFALWFINTTRFVKNW